MPDLANLRNAKTMIDVLKGAGPHDAGPKLVLNMVGLPKRPEIGTAEFAKPLELEPAAVIPFDAALFGTAANNGQMIAEVQPGGRIAETLSELAAALAGRAEAKRSKRSLLAPLLTRMGRKRA